MVIIVAVWLGLTVVCAIAGAVQTSRRPVLAGNKIQNHEYVTYERALGIERVLWLITLIVGVVGACLIPIVGMILEIVN